MSKSPDVVRLAPDEYIHVLDHNTNVTRVVEGPLTFTKQDNEKIVAGQRKRMVIPPMCYCIIENPVMRDADGFPIKDRHGMTKNYLGDLEVRFHERNQSFVLYPNEVVKDPGVQSLKVLPPNTGLRLRCKSDFTDANGDHRVAGDEWIFEGPGVYYPNPRVDVIREVTAEKISPGKSLRLRARQDLTDKKGIRRAAGEEWLVAEPGAYLPGPDEEVIQLVSATILNDRVALVLEAVDNFTDQFGVERKAGDQWLITNNRCPTYTESPHERIVKQQRLIVLTPSQYCVVLDPVKDGRQHLGAADVRRGPCSFFLQPGESLEGNAVKNLFVLGPDEALLLEAIQDTEGHSAGQRWMLSGPCDYLPPVAVRVIEKRNRIALDENEGIYVRNISTGEIRAQIGESYMLKAHEELWEKPVNPEVLKILQSGGWRSEVGGSSGQKIDLTRVVSYNVPHQCVVQVYDFKQKKARVVPGPQQVLLKPDEEFTLLSLSGGKPKKEHQIKTLHIFLGPDFMTDVITVSTSDHARLEIQLSYTWYFDVNSEDENSVRQVFNVADFVGDACRAMSSRIRGAIAAEKFDNFHRNSSVIIKCAAFGAIDGAPKKEYRFPQNGLVINNVDIISVEPIDQKTREKLSSSVQVAIESSTKAQEAEAQHEAEAREQEAKGLLERQKIKDQAQKEELMQKLLDLTAENNIIEATGVSKAEAEGKAEAELVEGDASLSEAVAKAEAENIALEVALKHQRLLDEVEVSHQMEIDELEITRAKELAQIEAEKVQKQVESIGRDTLQAIARAEPELKAKLLSALNLQGYMMTDGSSSINLFNAASALTGFSGQQDS